MDEEIIMNGLHRFLRDINLELLKMRRIYNILEMDELLSEIDREQLERCLSNCCTLFQLWSPLNEMICLIEDANPEMINLQRTVNRKLRKIVRLSQSINEILAQTVLRINAQIFSNFHNNN